MTSQNQSSKLKYSSRYIEDKTMELLQSRNVDFLSNLFLEVNPYLTRILIASGVHDEHLKEVLHQTWETFFLKMEKFEGRSQIKTFICGILYNKVREYRREQKRFLPEEDISKIMDHSFTEDGWWKSEPTDPHRLLELRQASDLVKECMEGLSEQQMNAFIMKEVEEEESDSICDILGISMSNLRVLIFRAKEKLRKCLEGKAEVNEALL